MVVVSVWSLQQSLHKNMAHFLLQISSLQSTVCLRANLQSRFTHTQTNSVDLLLLTGSLWIGALAQTNELKLMAVSSCQKMNILLIEVCVKEKREKEKKVFNDEDDDCCCWSCCSRCDCRSPQKMIFRSLSWSFPSSRLPAASFCDFCVWMQSGTTQTTTTTTAVMMTRTVADKRRLSWLLTLPLALWDALSPVRYLPSIFTCSSFIVQQLIDWRERERVKVQLKLW